MIPTNKDALKGQCLKWIFKGLYVHKPFPKWKSLLINLINPLLLFLHPIHRLVWTHSWTGQYQRPGLHTGDTCNNKIYILLGLYYECIDLLGLYQVGRMYCNIRNMFIYLNVLLLKCTWITYSILITFLFPLYLSISLDVLCWKMVSLF